MSLPFEPAAHLAERFLRERVVTRIWERDPTIWRAEPGSEAERSILNRLGWLDVGRTMPPYFERLTALADAVASDSVDTVYLLGMGGSSLCAEVIQGVHGISLTHPRVVVLDTTDERTLHEAKARLDPSRSLFLVASKSGSTVEVTSLEKYFWAAMTTALGSAAGRLFVAITDEGTALQSIAGARGYRDTFINPTDIGGRFSALSLFGLVPAALVSAPVRDFLAAGATMADGCRQENHANAGLELGAFIGAAALTGRDKLTVILPPSLETLGLWIEQLVAESTGKHGKGVLPIVDEPLGRPEDYGQDRAFVVYASDRDGLDPQIVAALQKAGLPMLRLTSRLDSLGAEFFRWEFATAVAGAALGVNPFDEPNVAEAKAKTRSLLEIYGAQGRLQAPQPLVSDEAVDVFTRGYGGTDPAAVVRAAIESLKPGDYAAFLSYLPASSATTEAINGVRVAIRAQTRAATTLGVGPRYLHSTGQYHKGGPNTVLAFVITADDATQTEVPGTGYTFSVLKRAQALGDVDTLEAHGRRVIRLHVKHRDTNSALVRLFGQALKKATTPNSG
jgi:glucose-6-phosphate isomerase